MMQINLTPILQALIGLLAAIITYRLIPWIKARTDAQTQATLRAVIAGLVCAAENLGAQQRIADKLKWVEDQLAQQGYEVDAATIEAEVARLFPHQQPPDGDGET